MVWENAPTSSTLKKKPDVCVWSRGASLGADEGLDGPAIGGVRGSACAALLALGAPAREPERLVQRGLPSRATVPLIRVSFEKDSCNSRSRVSSPSDLVTMESSQTFSSTSTRGFPVDSRDRPTTPRHSYSTHSCKPNENPQSLLTQMRGFRWCMRLVESSVRGE